MKDFRICCFALVASCCAATAADDTTLKKVVKAKAEEIHNAIFKEDYNKVIDLTHPNVLKMLGSRDKMIALLESGMKEMKSRGFAFRSATMDDPSDPVTAGDDLYIVVPFLLEMKAPGGKLLQKSFVIGVSSDQGKTWTFVNGDQEMKKIKQVLPDLPDKLKLPERQKPTFEKD